MNYHRQISFVCILCHERFDTPAQIARLDGSVDFCCPECGKSSLKVEAIVA